MGELFNNEEIAGLYDSFVAALSSASDLSDFSRDDLIDIYDYASDNNDEFVKTEVLMLASRRYPNDRGLKERRVVYYLGIGEKRGAAVIANSLPANSFIKRLVLFELSGVKQSDSDFEALFANVKPSSLTDEEVIRLVDTFVESDCFDMLLKNSDRIKLLCQYPDTLLYELTLATVEAGNNEAAQKYVQELTMLEPYNTDFWVLLSDIYLNKLNKAEEAMQTVDYALAIDPRCRAALVIKVKSLFELNGSKSEIEQAINTLLMLDKNDVEALFLQAIYLADIGMVDEAKANLAHCAGLGYEPQVVINFWIYLNNGKVDDSLAKAIGDCVSEMPEEIVLQWAMTHCKAMHYDVAAHMLMSYMLTHADASVAAFDMMLEMLYRAGKYADVIARFNDRYDSPYQSVEDPSACLLYALSRKRCGETNGLIDYINKVMESENGGDMVTLASNARIVGYSYYFLQLRDALQNDSAYPESFYDPFVD